MSDEDQVIQKVGKITKGGAVDSLAKVQPIPEMRVQPDSGKFDLAMERAAPTSFQHGKVEGAQNNLIDEVRALNRQVENVDRATPAQLAEQSKAVIAQIQDIKNKLSDPGLEIKGNYKNILRNKLEHIDENLRTALNNAGLPYEPFDATKSQSTSPIGKFFDLLTHGQKQLNSLGSELAKMNAENMNPADMLMLQIRVNTTQQELEFFTSLLNKALESTKTIMNVQV